MVKKFGEVSYEDYPAITEEFVVKLQEGKLYGNQCTQCGLKYFPPRTACENFHSHNDMEDFEIPKEAVLKAYTIIHFAPDSHADRAPYIVAIGELEDGIRVLAHLVGLSTRPKIGMTMTIKSQSVGEDRAIFKFTKK